MRVILHIDSGPATGRKVLLRSGQRLTVGRSSLNDFAIEHDDQMSAKHFEVVTNSYSCCLVDLDSSNGTHINGGPVDHTELRDGDQVSAGATLFRVNIEGGNDSEDRQSNKSIATERKFAPVDPMQVNSLQTDRKQIPADLWEDISIETLSTDLVCCHGHSPMAVTAEQLAENIPLYLLVDFRKIGQWTPAALESPGLLFDWLPAEAASANSPVLFPAATAPGWRQTVDDAAGKDAVVLIFSSLSLEELVVHFRKQLRSGPQEPAELLGICWPSILAAQLTVGQSLVAQQIMAGIEYVLIEQPDTCSWRLIGHVVPDQVKNRQYHEQEQRLD